MMAAGLQTEVVGDLSKPFCISQNLYGLESGPARSPALTFREDLRLPAESFQTVPTDYYQVHDDREALVDDDSLQGEGVLPDGSMHPVPLDTDMTRTSGYHCHVPIKLASKKARNQLIAVVVLSTVFMVAEIIGGLLSNSLALVADATHLASDITGFLVSLVAVWLAKKKPSSRLTLGYYRAEVIGALLSVLIIWIVTGVLIYLAVMRIKNNDYKVYANEMLITASLGVVFNIILKKKRRSKSTLSLYRSRKVRKEINSERSLDAQQTSPGYSGPWHVTQLEREQDTTPIEHSTTKPISLDSTPKSCIPSAIKRNIKQVPVKNKPLRKRGKLNFEQYEEKCGREIREMSSDLVFVMSQLGAFDLRRTSPK